jgi:hypothetical protein
MLKLTADLVERRSNKGGMLGGVGEAPDPACANQDNKELL